MIESVFSKKLQEIVSHTTWGVIAGRGTGSMVTIEFGPKVLRRRRLTNNTLSNDAQCYQGTWGLFIKNALWRLAYDGNLLCNSESDNTEQGEMLLGLSRIEGAIVESVTFDPPNGSLQIILAGNLELYISRYNDSDDDSFAFFTSDTVYTVDSTRNIVVEER